MLARQGVTLKPAIHPIPSSTRATSFPPNLDQPPQDLMAPFQQISSQSCTRAQLQYRNDGTLVVPVIRIFEPPSPTCTPQALFPHAARRTRQWPRFIRQSNDSDFLIFTDGACLNNGQSDPAAGWGFVFRAPAPNHLEIGMQYGRLENRGPSGEAHAQTSNRAELRAVIAALHFRAWYGEGWTRLVIATDSEYVTKGATEWVHVWGGNGWRTSTGTAVKNRDLWEELLGEVLGHQNRGLHISFWRIPRVLNGEADRIAKRGAEKAPVKDFETIFGVLC
ncbi:Ribonuclease H [Lachnellula cervina]|uniref:ribonuclease H n=1 Tax=Lachnellula cervina TaxID=1316786 RepID=A0A7D8YVQ0_9HELO|nr:Ribonuclease H [Lachnellula cervina]